MHYSLQYQHLVEGISEHQRSRWMNRNEVLAGLEGGHVEEIIATPIIQPKPECLHLRADSPNIVAELPDICKVPTVDSGDGGDNNGDNTGEANESGLVWRLAFWLPFWGAKTAYPVEALWNAAGNYKFRGAQIWAGKGCRLPTGESLMPTEPWGKSVQQDHLTTACNDRTCFKSPNQRPHFRAESSTSHAEDTAPSWKQLFLRSERNLWMLRARSARSFDNVTKVTGPSTLKK